MSKSLLLSFLFSLLTFYGLAQERTVTGRVTSSEDGGTMPGVNVIVKGTSIGAITDANGGFSIRVPSQESVLIFTFIGFQSKEVRVGALSVLDVSLSPDLIQLSEVVISGYGEAIPKRELTGAISKISGGEIENLPLQSFDKAMQGRTSGVLIQSASGVPGGPVSIRIRGEGSISAGNSPLIIVDGVQMNSTDNSSFTQSNPLAFLNPNDIESIEVLKDAATAAIYGAQAGNGVILVTTKRGKVGDTRFNFSYYRGVTEPMPIVDVMNSQQLIQARMEAVENANPFRANVGGISRTPRERALIDLGLNPALTDEEIAALPTYNWQKEAFRTGIVDNYELSASGGNDKTTYYGSASYYRQDANVIGMDFKRGTAKFAVTHKATSKLTIDQNINLSTITQNGNLGGAGPSGAFGAPQYASTMILPWIPIYNEDGTFNAPNEGFAGAMRQNVIQVASYNKVQSVTNQVVGNLFLNYAFSNKLSFRSSAGIDYRVLKGDLYYDPRTPDGFARKGLGQAQNDYNTNFITNHVLNYNTKINEDHSLSGFLGAEYRSEVREGYSMSAEGFPTFQFYTIQSAATPLSNTSFWTSFRRAGVFGKVNYDFKKKYFFNTTLRYDGSSRFGANNKFGFFPSVSGAWVVSEESFMEGNSYVNFAKLRLSYGQTGNDQIGNFDSRGLYQGSGNYNNQPGITPTGIANPNLRWERNITTNLGIDYGFFNNRVFGSIDVFKRISSDLLLNQPLPWISGYGSLTSNLGELENKGLEIEVGSINVRKNGFEWRTNFNITYIRNQVTKLFDGLEVLPGNQSVRVGQPLGTNFTRVYAGANPATGRPMWYDANGNITYNALSPGDFKVIGSDFADRFGGLTNTFTYKGFELDVFFQYEYGRQAFDSQGVFWSQLAQTPRNGLSYYFNNRWTEPGQITTVPRPYLNGAEPQGSSQTIASSRYFHDASYIRLKQITLSYNIPAVALQKVKLASAKVYVQGINLLTWTEWPGYDPEWVGSSNQGNIPQTRNYTIGVQVGF